MNQKQKRVFIEIIILVFIICIYSPTDCMAEDEVTSAKSGIVEVITCFSDQDGNYYDVKNCSGFLVSNNDGNVYIITTYSGITISEEEKTEFYKAKNEDIESGKFSPSVRMIIEGDVSSELNEVASSEDCDFCILSSNNVINEKKAVKIENVDEINIGDNVYTLGFSIEDKEHISKYTSDDVCVTQGEIKGIYTAKSGQILLQHSAEVNAESSGGVLINDNGYVIGIINAEYSGDDGFYYATPILEITEVLDNYGIIYQSDNREKLIEELNTLYSECEDIYESDEYTSDSKEEISQALSLTDEILSNIDTTETNKITEQIEILKQTKTNVVKKIPKMVICIIILGAADFVLIIWLIKLLVKRKIRKKPIHKNKKISVQNALDNINFEENIDNDKTEIFTDINEKIYKNPPRLRNENTGEIILIKKNKFRIGKNSSVVDYAIKNNNKVSRLHAMIVLKDRKYILYDLNSSNGTYVNQNRVNDMGIEIKSGDKITFADEYYRFVIDRTDGNEK